MIPLTIKLIRILAFIIVSLGVISCRSRPLKPNPKLIAYEFINHVIDTNSCPQLDQTFLLEDAGWDTTGFSPMYSSIIEEWFNEEDLKSLVEQQEKCRFIKLDSSLIKKKILVSPAKIDSLNSYSYISFPLFNSNYTICIFKAGYAVKGLAAGSAMYIFMKMYGIWRKVEMFGVSM